VMKHGTHWGSSTLVRQSPVARDIKGSALLAATWSERLSGGPSDEPTIAGGRGTWAALGDLLAPFLTHGNQVSVLRDGTETLPAMFRAIRASRRYVHLEYYVVEDVSHEGESLSDLLIKKSEAGVQIAILFDAVGSSSTPPAFVERLRSHGVQLLPFNPVNPLKRRSRYAPNRRSHRKLLISDGEIAMVGGVNMSREYQSYPDRPLSLTTASERTSQRHWRDTDLQLEGPAVAHLQRLFLEHWSQQGGRALAERGFFPPPVDRGHEFAAIIGSTPDTLGLHYYGVLLAALRGAKHRVWITAGYFLPTDEQMRALAQAASRNVDVKLLLPEPVWIFVC